MPMKILRGPIVGIMFLSIALANITAQSSMKKPEECKPSAPKFHSTFNPLAPKLHGTLNANFGFYGDFRLETLTFRLMNDSNETVDSDPASWTLFIDDRKVSDSYNIFLNGGAPTGGYQKVRSGATYEFGKTLPVAEYFPKDREYKVYWKASGFKSNVAVVRGGSIKK